MKRIIEKSMLMNDESWQKHASPWSVWTRVITGIPVTFGAVWSIQSLGYLSSIPIVVAILWLWLNTRLFPAPKKVDNWASKVTFGERIWLGHSKDSIPKHHRNWIMFLSISAGIGFFIGITGAYLNLLLPTLLGGTISWFSKMWFCDRMVWVYEDMRSNIRDSHESL
jgi:hypothetical protein